ASESLRTLCGQADETATRLKAQTEENEKQALAQREEARIAAEEESRQREAAATAHREALQTSAQEARQQLESALETARTNWQNHLNNELESAHTRWQGMLDSGFSAAQSQAAAALTDHSQTLVGQIQEEGAKHSVWVRESAANSSAEIEQRLSTLKGALQEQKDRLDAVLNRAQEAILQLEQFSARVGTVHQQGIEGFQTQLDDVLSLHRNELHRRSESLFDEINARIRATFEEASHQAVAHFDQQVESMVGPHIARTDDAIQRLAGGRALLDA